MTSQVLRLSCGGAVSGRVWRVRSQAGGLLQGCRLPPHPLSLPPCGHLLSLGFLNSGLKQGSRTACEHGEGPRGCSEVPSAQPLLAEPRIKLVHFLSPCGPVGSALSSGRENWFSHCCWHRPWAASPELPGSALWPMRFATEITHMAVWRGESLAWLLVLCVGCRAAPFSCIYSRVIETH